ncbi:MAG: hypothetical protein ABI318_14460 [Chthoniobacteraceae bacterium]
MRSLPFVALIISIVLSVLPGCAGTRNPHFFPRMHPLFAGLDESKVCGCAKAVLAKAKTDFQLARHGEEPRYAKYVSTIPYTHSRVYEGKGYCLTMVNKDLVSVRYEGPRIVLDACITGDKPFAYDEVNAIGD